MAQLGENAVLTHGQVSLTTQSNALPAEEKDIRSPHKEVCEIGPESPSTVQSPVSYPPEKNTSEKPASRYSKFLKPETLKPGLAKDIVSAVVGSPSETSSTSSKDSRRPWKTTLIRFGPLSGLFAMALAIGSIVAALGVLAGSDHQPVSEWSAPPLTYLAILTAIANLSVRYATFQGAIVAWWFRAYGGCSLRELHLHWRSGSSFRGALTAGRNMGLLGLACVLSTVVVIDGPLLQRASTVITVTVADKPISLDVRMAPEIPTASTGSWVTDKEVSWLGKSNLAFNDTIPTNSGPQSNGVWPNTAATWEIDVVGPYYQSSPIEGVVKGCSKQCKANITGPTLVPTICTSSTAPLYYNHTLNTTSLEARIAAPPLSQDAILVSVFLLIEGPRETLNLISQYGTSSNCEGTVETRICTLESGIGTYEVLIENDRIMMDTLPKPSSVTLANNTAVNHTWVDLIGGHPSTLGGIASLLSERWDLSVIYFKNGNSPISGIQFGTGIPTIYQKHGDLECPSYRDPYEAALSSFNKLMLYSGASAGQRDAAYLASHLDSGLEVNTTVSGVQVGTESVFHTDYWFFFAAALIEVVCVACILPTYWGWWRIGRQISFSPLELAKAFEAPILEDSNSNATGADLAKIYGDAHVKYGLVEGAKTKLALRDSSSVGRPAKDMRFDD